VGAVDLVDHDDHAQAERQRLAQHETRLRHGAVDGVDQQQRAVDHIQHALHLAAKIGMARCVHDVDFHAVPGDSRVLRQDGDAALALERVAVQDALASRSGVAEDFRLLEHAIDQGRFAVVDVRDDGNVANVVSDHRMSLGLR